MNLDRKDHTNLQIMLLGSKEGEFIWMRLRVSIQSVTFVFLQKDFSSNMTKHEFCIFRMNMCHFSHSFWNLNTS